MVWSLRMRGTHHLLGLLILFCAGCSTLLPTQEMSDARQAIQAAQAVHADQYATRGLQAAEARLNTAEQHLATGDLNTAREQAISAKEAAIAAHTMTVAIVRAEVLLKDLHTYDTVAAPTVEALLQKAYLAAKADEKRSTLYYADEAYREAKRLLNPHYLTVARQRLTAIRMIKEQLNPEQIEILKAAESAFLANEGRKAQELLRSLPNQNADCLKCR